MHANVATTNNALTNGRIRSHSLQPSHNNHIGTLVVTFSIVTHTFPSAENQDLTEILTIAYLSEQAGLWVEQHPGKTIVSTSSKHTKPFEIGGWFTTHINS